MEYRKKEIEGTLGNLGGGVGEGRHRAWEMRRVGVVSFCTCLDSVVQCLAARRLSPGKLTSRAAKTIVVQGEVREEEGGAGERGQISRTGGSS